MSPEYVKGVMDALKAAEEVTCCSSGDARWPDLERAVMALLENKPKNITLRPGSIQNESQIGLPGGR